MLINHIYDFIGETGSSKRKRHRKASTEGGSQMRELHNAISGSGNTSEMGKVESWFHEDCISWMADIRLVGHVILGIFLPNQYYQFLVITTRSIGKLNSKTLIQTFNDNSIMLV